MSSAFSNPYVDIRETFVIELDNSVDAIFKKGILRTFHRLLKRFPSQTAAIKAATVSALSTLSKMDVALSEQHRPVNGEKVERGFGFFSSFHQCFVEYIQPSPTKITIRTRDNIPPPRSNKKLLSRQQSNIGFKILFLQILNSYPDAEMEKVFLQGVFFVLQEAEDFAGLGVEVFREHQSLFAALRDVYGKAEFAELDASTGCYNKALTTEVSSTIQ